MIYNKIAFICPNYLRFFNTLGFTTPGVVVNCLLLPVRAMNCSETSTATRTCASLVLAPRCGVATTFGCWISSKVTGSVGGSFSKTSKAAPPHRPSFKACNKSASLMIPPLATLTIRTPFLQELNTLSQIKSEKSRSQSCFKCFSTHFSSPE
jgi:hypothetical protein